MSVPNRRVRSLSDDANTNPNFGKKQPILTHAQRDSMKKQLNQVANEKRKMKRTQNTWNEVKIPPPPSISQPKNNNNNNNNNNNYEKRKPKPKKKFKPKNMYGPKPGDAGYDSDESIFVKQTHLEKRRHSFGSSNSSWRTMRTDLPPTSMHNKNNIKKTNMEVRKRKGQKPPVIVNNNAPINLNVGGFGIAPVSYKEYKRKSQMQPKNIFAEFQEKKNKELQKNNADVVGASELMHKRNRNELGQIEGELTEKEFYKKYWIDNEKLGQGSFARVRKVTRKADGHIYALKMIKKAGKSKEDLLALQREIAILSKLNDKNVVKLDDWCETDKRIYMVVEFCDGGDVFDRILKKKTFSEKEAVHVVKSVASGLQHIHKNNIIHRDLKPDNLMYLNKNENSAIKIIDFGLAGDCSNGPLSTPCGTVHYVAPEVLSATTKTPYDTKSDMWSLGVIIYMLLCGFPPFFDATGNTKRLHKLVKGGKYRFPSPYWDYVSESAKDLIKNLLMLDSKKRYSAKQVLNHKWIKGSDIGNKDLGKIYMEQMKHFSSSRKMLQQGQQIHRRNNKNKQPIYEDESYSPQPQQQSQQQPKFQKIPKQQPPMYNNNNNNNNNSNNYNIFAHKQYQPNY